MLGKAVLTQYITAEDFRTPADYISYMFGGRSGWYSRNQKCGDRFTERWMRHDSITSKRWNNLTDCYMSQNSFLSPRKAETPGSGRKCNNVKCLNALYVDIDCYNMGYSTDDVIYALESMYFDTVLPRPTFIIDSGRGLYLIWRIREDRNALTRWQAVERYLVEQCADLGADSKASDAARILRVPGTVNSKSGTKVRIVDYTNVQYSLHEIIREYGIKPHRASQHRVRPDGLPTHPYGTATERMRKTALWISTALQIPLPDFENFNETSAYIGEYLPKVSHNDTERNRENHRTAPINLPHHKSIQTILAGRLADLRRLFALRKGEDCCREIALFLTRLWSLELSGDTGYATEQMLSFNSTLDSPFTEQYALSRTASAERKYKSGNTYRYSTQKLIAALRITEEEQAEMQYLCDTAADAKSRKKQANRRAYLSRLSAAGKSTKSTALRERRESMAQMLAQGAGKAEICHALNISERTYARDKAAVEAEGLIEQAIHAMEQAMEALAIVTQAVKAVVGGSDSAIRQDAPFFQSSYYASMGYAHAATAAIPSEGNRPAELPSFAGGLLCPPGSSPSGP